MHSCNQNQESIEQIYIKVVVIKCFYLLGVIAYEQEMSLLRQKKNLVLCNFRFKYKTQRGKIIGMETFLA